MVAERVQNAHQDDMPIDSEEELRAVHLRRFDQNLWQFLSSGLDIC